MISAPQPANESARLAALQEYGILDTPPEAGFDDLVHLASQICDTPMAVVSLVDSARQWFKARIGVDACQTSREIAFCAHAILQKDGLFIVPNALADARFADNPLVVDDPRLRFYAGAPLVSPEGQAVGVLCVMDRRPRELTESQRHALSILGRQVVTQLQLRRELTAHAKAEQRLREKRKTLVSSMIKRRAAIAEIKRRDAMLEAVASLAAQLMERGGLPEVIQEGLARLGRAAGVSRVNLFQNRRGPGDTVHVLLHSEWLAEGVRSLTADPTVFAFEFAMDGFARWVAELGQGRVIKAHIADLPAEERAKLEAQGVVSVLVAPIFAGDGREFWGTIGFDECTCRRTWSVAEADALRSVAALLAAAIRRQQVEAALRDSAARYSNVVNTLKEVIFQTDAAGLWTFLNPAWTEILGFPITVSLGTSFLNYVHPDDRERNLALFAPLIERKKDYCRHEIRYVTRDGGFRWIEVFARLTLDSQSNVTGTAGTLHDVTQRKLAEERLRESEALYQSLVEHLPLLILRKDAECRYVFANQRLLSEKGCFREQFLGKSDFDFLPADVARRHREQDLRVMQMGETLETLETRTGVSGLTRHYRKVKTPLRDGDNQINGLQVILWDVTQQHEMEVALRESETQLKRVIEGSNDGFWDWNIVTDEVAFSPRWLEMLGYEPGEIIPQLSSWERLVHPADLPGAVDRLHAHFEGRASHYEVEKRMRMKSGDWKWILARGKVATRDEAGRPLRITGTHTDISERKRFETELRDSLREKELLLKEIHHRVKNNMQVISSLLNLQADCAENPQVQVLFADAQHRINSMALVHERLYQSRDLGHIDFAEYLRGLVENLAAAHGDHARQVCAHVDATDLLLGIDTAIPCGLIVNELVSNAFKHGFPDGGAGMVTVVMGRDDAGLQLMVRDTGRGLPAGINFERTDSLGMKLVLTLVRQLHGQISWSGVGGTTIEIRFAEPCPSPRSRLLPSGSGTAGSISPSTATPH